MIGKNNRLNHDFQIAYFLAGSCHTPDGAYSLLCDLREDREMALANVESNSLRSQAKLARAKQTIIETHNEADRLEALADISEIESNETFAQRNIIAAKKELDFINKLIDKLQPLRKFAHLEDSEAHEASQFDEWKFELINRAENYLLTTGTIPTDHFTTMQQHPAFKEDILPAIIHAKELIGKDQGMLLQHMHDRQSTIRQLVDQSIR